MLRIAGRVSGAQLMLGTLVAALPAMVNISCMLLLLFFIWAVVGVQLFGNVRYGYELNEHTNFRNVGNAMLVLTRCVTGENWNGIMHDCAVAPPGCTPFATVKEGYWMPNDCGSPAASVGYFISFYLIGVVIVMNLFVTVILDNFDFVSNVQVAGARVRVREQ